MSNSTRHTLKDGGFRFVLQNAVFAWVHPASGAIRPDAVDCTDMSDDQFEAVVRANEAAIAKATGSA